MIIEMKEHMEEDYDRSLDLISRQERALREKGVSEEKIIKEKENKINNSCFHLRLSCFILEDFGLRPFVVSPSLVSSLSSF